MHVPIDACATLRTLPPLGFAHELLNRPGADDPDFAKHLELLLSYGDPFGRVLIAKDGRSDPEARIPYLPGARARKARSDATLEKRGVRVLDRLPPMVAEEEVELRSMEDVSRRALALFLVAQRAAALKKGEAVPAPAELERRSPIAFKALSPRELGFVHAAVPAPQDIVDFIWRYGALHALVWAVGGAHEIRFPSLGCDPGGLTEFMGRVSEEEFFHHARLRPPGEILDELDLVFRCHWPLRQERSDGEAAGGDLAGSVVQELHHALNWLTRFENAAWDDVQTPT